MVLYEREDDHDQVEHPATTKKELRVREGMGQRIACCVIGLAKGEKPKVKPIPKPKTTLKEDVVVEKAAPILKKVAVKEAPKVAVRKVAVAPITKVAVPRRQSIRYVAPVSAYTPRYARGYGYGAIQSAAPQW